MKYYAILGHYTGKVIGLTSDYESVWEEEPEAQFVRISKEEFEEWSDLDEVPLEKLKARPVYYVAVSISLQQLGIVK